MKIRNKKTGEIREDSDLGRMLSRYEMPSFESIAELCEEWEDYAPAEPLIKDEKVRKAVRAWAEANNSKRVVIQNDYCLSSEDDIEVEIVFAIPVFKSIDDNDFYTIAELCGDEEE